MRNRYTESMQTTLGDERLRALLDARLDEGAEKEAIDAEIWELFGEEWCVMATDLAGFSRNVAEFGIIHFLQTIRESERVLVPLIDENGGQLLKIEGDSFLAIFRDAEHALRASIAMQRAARALNEGRAPEDRMLLGIGLGLGRVLRVAENDVFGNEVNSASILGETHAAPFDVLVTEAVKKAAPDGMRFEAFHYTPPGAASAWKLVYDAG